MSYAIAIVAGYLAGSIPTGYLLVGGIAAGVWIVCFVLFRYASVASMVAACAVPVVTVLLGEPWPVIVFAAGAAVAVIVLHWPNIARLRAGTESRFRFRHPASV